jgi:hypothetical protein
MKYLMALLCLFFACNGEPDIDEPVERQAIQEVEILLHRTTGEILTVRGKQESRTVWMQMFANGIYKTHTELANITPDVQWQQDWVGTELVFNHVDTLRVDTLDIVAPWDSLNFVVDSVYYNEEKIRPETYGTALSEFTSSSFFPQLPEDVLVDGKPFYDSWPYGRLEKKDFSILRGEFQASFVDSLVHLTEPDGEGGSERVKWKVALQTLRDSTNIENITIRQARDNLDLSVKEKTWIVDNIMSLPGINLDTTMLQLWQDPRVDKRIFRHPKIIKALKRLWVTRL